MLLYPTQQKKYKVIESKLVSVGREVQPLTESKAPKRYM